jgi:lactoylglutathione lyase
MTVLKDDYGMHVNMMKGSKASYPKYFHIGFNMETEANVNAVYECLKNGGMAIDPPEHAWGFLDISFQVSWE